MRKTLSTIVLALALVFAVVPIANADGPGGPTPGCIDAAGKPVQCPPTGPAPTPCLDAGGRAYEDVVSTLTSRLDAKGAQLQRDEARIARQAKLIKRLRHRLATRHHG